MSGARIALDSIPHLFIGTIKPDSPSLGDFIIDKNTRQPIIFTKNGWTPVVANNAKSQSEWQCEYCNSINLSHVLSCRNCAAGKPL